MTMIQKLLLLSIFILLTLPSQGRELKQDSLLLKLQSVMTPQDSFTIYRNLADLVQGTPEEINYLHSARKTAIQMKNIDKEMSILSDIFIYYADSNNIDSAGYYRKQIIALPNIEKKAGYVTFVNMFYFKLLHALNKSQAALEIEKNKLADTLEKSNGERIESAYIVGSALFKNDNPTLSFTYMEQALDLVKDQPIEEWYRVKRLILKSISYNYLLDGQYQKAINMADQIFKLNNTFYDKYIRQDRPFFNINGLFLSEANTIVVALRMVNRDRLPEFIAKVIPILKDARNFRDKYNGFLALNNYYLDLANYKESLVTNDSLIKYAKIIFPENLPGLYNINSQIYEATGNYKDALKMLKTSYALEDSISTKKTQKQLVELQVQYDLEKLNYDKSQLEVKNKRIVVTSLVSILIILTGICLYLYLVLKKERLMKAHIRLLQQRAEESEKMKTAFINSICHEIRTPLNGIVGFTDLIFEESIDEESRKLFPAEIRKNTILLTSLIDCMLEVSRLDVSNEMLERSPSNLNDICIHEFTQIKTIGNENLNYMLSIPKDGVIINTHERYLSIVLEQLLNNASKFTKEGSVMLQMYTDNDSNEVVIKVSDTGNGIPSDKHDEVFERFTKLDIFSVGSGLGLYLSRLIVTRLGGRIVIDTKYTDGTSVVVRLPL